MMDIEQRVKELLIEVWNEAIEAAASKITEGDPPTLSPRIIDIAANEIRTLKR